MENIMQIQEVKNVWQALKMRKIRNECREFMTQDKSEIGVLRQIQWFERIYKSRRADNEMVAYLGVIEGQPMAYGLIRGMNSRPILSGGIVEHYRGKGLGKELFGFLMREASKGETGRVGDKSVFLEVLEINTPAFNLYKSLGFVEKHRERGIIFMQKDWGEMDR